MCPMGRLIFLLICQAVAQQQLQPGKQQATRATNTSFATLIYGNSETKGFVRGTLALLESLRATQTTAPLVVMVANVSESDLAPLVWHGCVVAKGEGAGRGVAEGLRVCDGQLHRQCCLLLKVAPVGCKVPTTLAMDADLQHFDKVLTKLRAWLLPFERVVFLDSDTLVMAGIDHMFLNPELSAVLDGDPNRTDQYVNSGVFVLEPNAVTFENMIKVASRHSSTFHFPDQDFLNMFFAQRKHFLSEAYNAQLGHGRPVVSNVYILHFFAHPKPWDYLLDVDAKTFAPTPETTRQEFTRQLAAEREPDIAYRLLADGSDGFEKYPPNYLATAFQRWFEMALRAEHTIHVAQHPLVATTDTNQEYPT